MASKWVEIMTKKIVTLNTLEIFFFSFVVDVFGVTGWNLNREPFFWSSLTQEKLFRKFVILEFFYIFLIGNEIFCINSKIRSKIVRFHSSKFPWFSHSPKKKSLILFVVAVLSGNWNMTLCGIVFEPTHAALLERLFVPNQQLKFA